MITYTNETHLIFPFNYVDYYNNPYYNGTNDPNNIGLQIYGNDRTGQQPTSMVGFSRVFPYSVSSKFLKFT